VEEDEDVIVAEDIKKQINLELGDIIKRSSLNNK
jgi:hypothetical protein